MKTVNKILRSNTFRNSGWIIGGRVLQMAISMIVTLLTARYLGPSNYGLINYGTSFVTFFTSFCTLGINSLLVKEFVDHPQREGMVIGTTLVMRGVSSLLSAVTIITLVSVIDRDEPTTILVVALCSLGLFFSVFDTFNYWFQRHLKSKYTALAMLAAYAITAAYRLVLVITDKNVEWFALASSVDHICVALLLIIFYKKCAGQGMDFSWQYGKELLSRSKHFILSGLMVAIYGQTDKLMLKQMLDVTQTGYYSTATAVNAMWCFVLGAIINSLCPSIVEANNTGDAELFARRNRQMYAIVFYVSTFVAVLFNIFGDLVIYILYGKSYMPAAAPLRIVSWYTAFSYLGVARETWVVCKNKQKNLIKIYATAAIGNVVLNLVLIPIWGASGAALASLISQILTGLVLPFFIKDLRENAKLMLEGILLKDMIKKKKA